MEKNVAGKWIVFAYGLPDHANPGQPITGDAANITANIRIDGGAANAVDDTNPTELEDGYYVFDTTADESNGDLLLLAPASSTANVQVIAVPGAVWTRPANFNDLSVASSTGRMDVGSVAGTAQTANDNSLDINTLITNVATLISRLTATRASNLDELGVANLPADIDTLLARLTSGRAGYLDELSAANIPADVDALLSRLSATRAGYLDKLNISGNVAASSEVTAIQNNTRVRVIVPLMIERPDSGSTLYKLHLYIYDEAGNMEAPDSAPTLTVVNESGASRAANLGTVTLESAGHYSVTYTVADSHAIEQLIFEWTVIEGAVTRYHGAASQIVDTTAVDFTSADRTKLVTLHDTRCTEARMAELDAANLPAGTDDIQSRIPAALVGGRMDVSVSALDGNVNLAKKLKEHVDAEIIEADTAQGGTSSSITLASGSSSVDDDYLDLGIYINAGTGINQYGRIDGYDGATKVANIVTPTTTWTVTPDATSGYILLSAGALVHMSQIHAAALAQINAEMDNALITAIGTAGAGLTDLGGMSTGMKAEILVEVVKVFVTQMTESYAADGVAPTFEQCLFMIMQSLSEFEYAGVTKTTKKLDKSTTAMTHTLDDAADPTSQTRAT